MIPDFLHNNEIVAHEGKPYLVKVELLPFEQWPASVKYKYAEAMEADKGAIVALQIKGITNPDKQVEQYAYCKSGGFDNKADISKDGKITDEYFECPQRDNCPAKAQQLLCKWIKAANGFITPREVDIIRLIATDKADKEIADTLQLSYNTIAKHRTNIEHKIGCEAKPGIVRFAYESGII